jgi:hypothetical protein
VVRGQASRWDADEDLGGQSGVLLRAIVLVDCGHEMLVACQRRERRAFGREIEAHPSMNGTRSRRESLFRVVPGKRGLCGEGGKVEREREGDMGQESAKTRTDWGLNTRHGLASQFPIRQRSGVHHRAGRTGSDGSYTPVPDTDTHATPTTDTRF